MQHDIAIVICTVCRESLLRAIGSIYEQAYAGPIQVLIGVDIDAFDNEAKLQQVIFENCPPHIQVNWVNMGYSTSQRHGGVHSCFYGGSLRTSLSFLANSQYIMYLDDDDWLGPNHCTDVLNAIQNKSWAFSYSIYADGNEGIGICTDEIESVGVGEGIYKDRFGGFVRPSGLLLDKNQLSHLLHLWSSSPYPSGDGEDRLIFEHLRHLDHGCTSSPSVYYALDPKDGAHEIRMNFIKKQNPSFQINPKKESVR